MVKSTHKLKDTLYFTGTHRVNDRNAKTGLILAVRGFNPARKMIEDVGGAVDADRYGTLCSGLVFQRSDDRLEQETCPSGVCAL